MRFDLGYGTRNMLLNRSFTNAAYRQTALEHQNYIDEFARQRMANGENPAMAYYEAETIDEPTKVEKYWNDFEPRRPVDDSSSWVNSIEHLPDAGMSVMTTNGGKEYYYPQTSDEAGDWITSDSIGGYYNNFVKTRG
jgi:hypothetical protein